jgi:hypothetical protein
MTDSETGFRTHFSHFGSYPPITISSTSFPSLFNDSESLGPSALLYAAPTLTTTMTYGEG